MPTVSVNDCGKAVSQKKAAAEPIPDTVTAANRLGGAGSGGGGGGVLSLSVSDGVGAEQGGAAIETSAADYELHMRLQRQYQDEGARAASEREKTPGCGSTDAQKSDEELVELLDQREQAKAETEKKRKHEEFLASEELAKLLLQEDDHTLASASKRRGKQVSLFRFMQLAHHNSVM
jgi:hypothetical protein